MPGGRLTQDERRRIAAGLASGLGYAQIARGLDRPTSTVTREVLRNGGFRAYQPDRAHERARARARRSRTGVASSATGSGVAAGHSKRPELSTAVEGFADRFVEMMVSTGLPRMPSRVLMTLYLTEPGSLTAAELVTALQVSPASISKAMRYLEMIGLMQRSVEPGTRRERYMLGDDLWDKSWESSRRANADWAQGAAAGAALFPEGSKVRARFQHAARFFEHLGQGMAAKTGTLISPDVVLALEALARAGHPITRAQLDRALTPDQRAILLAQ